MPGKGVAPHLERTNCEPAIRAPHELTPLSEPTLLTTAPVALEEEPLRSSALQSTATPRKLGDALSSARRGKSQAKRPDWLQRGEKVGQYEIQDRVGMGGFGALYRATRDGKDYALKIPLSKLEELDPVERDEAEERLGREVGTLLMVRHPNVVRVREFFRWPSAEEGFVVIVMDFVHGRPFYRWRREATPSLRTILTALSKLGRALDGLHRHNIHHRDIKSGNVLVTDSGDPVLVDFGISRPQSAFTVTREATLLGTYTHWAPEYVAFYQSSAFDGGERFRYAPTTDLYALGNMAYGALCGREPHWYADVDSSSGVLPGLFVDALLGDTLEPPSKYNAALPAGVDALCLKLLAKRPEDRFQSGAELSADLDAVLARKELGSRLDAPLEVPPAPGPDERSSGSRTRGRSRPPPPPPESISLAAPAPPAVAPVGRGDKSAARRAPPSGSQDKTDKVPAVRERLTGAPAQPVDAGAVKAAQSAVAKTANKGARRVGDADYLAPSIAAAHAFVSPVACAAPAALPKAGPLAGLSSTVLKADALIKAADRGRKPQWLPYLLAGVGLLGFTILAVAVNAPLESKAAPQSLLTQLEKDAASRFAESTAPDGFDPPPPPATAAAPLDPPATPPKAKRRGQGADAQQVDALLTREYADRPLPLGETGKSKADLPPWMKARPREPDARGGQAAITSGVPMGSEIPVRLQKPLDSRTVASGPVVGRLPRPFALRGRVVLPTGTMVYGTASSSGAGRFDIRFTRLKLPDNTELEFAGLAMDAGDKKAGLAPSRRISTSRSEPGLVTRVIKGTAAGVLSKVTGGDGVDIARSAGETVLGHEEGASAPPSEALLLDAPVDFSIFVTAAF